MHGFVGAFAGAAVFLAVGGILLLVLLRKRHLDAIATAEPVIAAA